MTSDAPPAPGAKTSRVVIIKVHPGTISTGATAVPLCADILGFSPEQTELFLPVHRDVGEKLCM